MPGLPLSDLERCRHCGVLPVLIKGVTGTVYANGRRCLNVTAEKFPGFPTSCLSRPPLRLFLMSFSATSAASSAMINLQSKEASISHGKFWLILLRTVYQYRQWSWPTSQSKIHTDTHVHCICKAAKRTLMGKRNIHTSFSWWLPPKKPKKFSLHILLNIIKTADYY